MSEEIKHIQYLSKKNQIAKEGKVGNIGEFEAKKK